MKENVKFQFEGLEFCRKKKNQARAWCTNCIFTHTRLLLHSLSGIEVGGVSAQLWIYFIKKHIFTACWDLCNLSCVTYSDLSLSSCVFARAPVCVCTGDLCFSYQGMWRLTQRTAEQSSQENTHTDTDIHAWWERKKQVLCKELNCDCKQSQLNTHTHCFSFIVSHQFNKYVHLWGRENPANEGIFRKQQ